MRQNAGPVAIAVVAIAVFGFIVWQWRNHAGAPTPVVDPNNPLPGMGPIGKPGEGMGPSPGTVEAYRGKRR